MTTFTTEDRINAFEPIPFAGMVDINHDIQLIKQGTSEWHQLRLGKVTASRVADIMAKTKTGASASRGNYLIELAIQRVTQQIEESYTNSAMQWGTETEPLARMAYELAKETFVEQVPFVDHPTIEWFGCSPDGLVENNGLVEIKCPNSSTHWSYLKSGEPPNKYFIQMQAQISCTQREWNDFISFDPRMPHRSQLFVKRVYRDDEFIKTMEKEIQQFLVEVQQETDLMLNREF
jgi:putative phage-type endonuclease